MVAMPDPLLLLGAIMLGMALGALLTTIRYKIITSRIVKEEIEKAQKQARPEGKKATDSDKTEAA